MQIVDNAIDRSKSHQEVVVLTANAIAQAGCNVESVCKALHAECEDWVDAGAVQEYWGKDVDDVEWRVHVRAEVSQ